MLTHKTTAPNTQCVIMILPFSFCNRYGNDVFSENKFVGKEKSVYLYSGFIFIGFVFMKN